MHSRMLVLVLLVGCGDVKENNKLPDAPVQIDACVPESDDELCAMADSCEMHSFTDRCNATRSVDCGGCDTGKGCVVGSCKTPVCSSFTYTSAPQTGMARPNVEDSIGAATPDGTTLVVIPSGGTCGAFRVVIADETTPGTYNQQDITPALSAAGVYTGQDGHTITPDGLTLIARNAASTTWVTMTRSAKGLTDFGPPSGLLFDAINAQLAALGGRTFAAPVLSADGLEFLYSISNPNDPEGFEIYSSVRANTSMPFPAGTPLPAPIDGYALATSLSSDRLTLFVFYGFTGRIFTRNSTSAAFSNPNEPADPPQISNWQHKVFSDCSKMVATASPGGCQNEDVVIMTRQ